MKIYRKPLRFNSYYFLMILWFLLFLFNIFKFDDNFIWGICIAIDTIIVMAYLTGNTVLYEYEIKFNSEIEKTFYKTTSQEIMAIPDNQEVNLKNAASKMYKNLRTTRGFIYFMLYLAITIYSIFNIIF